MGWAVNYYERHIGDYLKDTAHLSLLEHGVYGRLLDVYYIREAPISDDQAARLVGARAPDEVAAVRAVLAEFFVLADGAWHHSRCDREIARYCDKQAKAQQSANARWSNAKPSKIGCNANALQPQCESNAPKHQAPSTNTQSPTPTGDLQSPHPPLLSPGVADAPPAAPKKRSAKPKEPAPSAATWEAYASAYEVRYGEPPVRNATVNGQVAQFIGRVGAQEAPSVARFYVNHQRQDYVRSMHPVGLLLRDAEALRTAWATGRQVTNTSAAQADRTQTNANAFAPLLAQAELESLNG